MIALGMDSLMMIEPRGQADDPIVDHLTRLAAGAIAVATEGPGRYRGVHTCTGCGRACSDNADWHVGGMTTNSLLVHYVAMHRNEIPTKELAKLAALDVAPVEPTPAQISGVGMWG